MLFELINALAIFQMIMIDLLLSFLDEFVIVYLDDILIYNKNEEAHLQHVKLIIETLKKDNYYAKSSKCAFFQKHIEFCDHIIDDEKIKMNQNKLRCIRK